MNMTSINLTFSAVSLEGVDGFVKLIRDNVNILSFFHQGTERMFKYGNGTSGSYWIGTMTIAVLSADVNSTLVEIDAVKYGFVSDAEEVLSNIFGDTRVEVILDSNVVEMAQLEGLNSYLHNKEQEHSRALEGLEVLVNTQTQKFDELETKVAFLEEQYRGLQVWLRSYINVEAVARVVRELAEQVDSSLLNDIEAHRIH